MKLTAIPRITLGLLSIALGLLLAFDLLFHLFPNDADTTAQGRSRLANQLAIQAAALLQARDIRAVDRTLSAIQSRDPDIVSIGLRRADGAIVSQAGQHVQHWAAPARGLTRSNALAVGIHSDQERWGDLEIVFRPLHQRAIVDWLFSGPAKMLLLFSATGGLLFFLYLRRMLQHLDPSAAVPERVRGAFDALTEGVLIVDAKEQVLLANQAFQKLAPASATTDLLGKRASALNWLTPSGSDADTDSTPWLSAMRSRKPKRGQPFQVEQDGAPVANVVLNCSPLLDEKGGVRGCLITLDDVTALERSHEQLLEVLADLATSKSELEHKNSELETLASRDALSGCLNRRAFFANFGQLFRQATARQSELICVMADIDHFKSINDRFGHGIGDEAIKRFASVLQSCVREGDLVGRYGGEEFCVVIPGLPLARGMDLAERMRAALSADRSIFLTSGECVTMSASFGVAALKGSAASTEAELIDQADKAMYLAKQGGRNQVVTIHPAAATQTFATLETTA